MFPVPKPSFDLSFGQFYARRSNHRDMGVKSRMNEAQKKSLAGFSQLTDSV